ncbi:Uncharacterized protein APZ42_034599 [Daphnia magna]|uniref:Uncharacterized protein n=1 Tax=Daphnia magna TaxID=35525 RepID=A0A164K045_9CRUS|nr:Uncharacterized protein APZ42_034599 [Daphnia magna]
MPPEALTFEKDSLASGAQPTKVRMMLQEMFSTHLISKDLINIKQTLTGKSEDEWKDTVKFLQVLHKDENNVVHVMHDSDEEVAATFVQMERERKLYEKYGKLL